MEWIEGKRIGGRDGEDWSYTHDEFDDAVWESITAGGKRNPNVWDANCMFLDQSIERGQDFRLTRSPEKAEGALAREVQYLSSRGYVARKDSAGHFWMTAGDRSCGSLTSPAC